MGGAGGKSTSGISYPGFVWIPLSDLENEFSGGSAYVVTAPAASDGRPTSAPLAAGGLDWGVPAADSAAKAGWDAERILIAPSLRQAVPSHGRDANEMAPPAEAKMAKEVLWGGWFAASEDAHRPVHAKR